MGVLSNECVYRLDSLDNTARLAAEEYTLVAPGADVETASRARAILVPVVCWKRSLLG